jgi:hypothetical protein
MKSADSYIIYYITRITLSRVQLHLWVFARLRLDWYWKVYRTVA